MGPGFGLPSLFELALILLTILALMAIVEWRMGGVAEVLGWTASRKADRNLVRRSERRSSGFLEGPRYVWRKTRPWANLIMLFLIGTFGLNFPIFIATMAFSARHFGQFHGGNMPPRR
jgi:hypothetical protein